MQGNSKSPHILSTASNLFGLCFVVLTSLKVLKLDQYTIIDEITEVSMFLFMASCMFSFLSIRSKTKWMEKFEGIADYSFLSGLICLFLITLLIVFRIVH
jgi:hypothetical protein